ncbi:hypothetical protein [Neobacillus mesonae]|uniref:hypothetical protein n=1 Tax=Neobacillus mesonae TaxID=1193713 RepID=UPI002573CBE2|nr:hypothetical protein [Neobacillus mesonae]
MKHLVITEGYNFIPIKEVGEECITHLEELAEYVISKELDADNIIISRSYGKKACSNHLIREDSIKITFLTAIQELVKQIDKEQYLKKLEAQSNKSLQTRQKTLEKIDKQLEIIKGRKRKYINMLAEEIITQEEYLENVEANNIELMS